MRLQNEFAEYINDWGNLRSGKLVLGGSNLYSSWVLPSLMNEFTQKFPLIQLDLVEATTPRLEKMLQNGEIDLLLDNLEMDEHIFDRHLFRKEYLVLAVPKHLEINRRLKDFQISETSIRDLSFLDKSMPAVDLNLFADVPFILMKTGNATRSNAMEICQQYNFTPKILFEMDQQVTTYNITCSGMGASFISNTLINSVPSFPNVVFYKLCEEKSSRNLYFFWKKGRYLNKIMQEFLKSANC